MKKMIYFDHCERVILCADCAQGNTCARMRFPVEGNESEIFICENCGATIGGVEVTNESDTNNSL